MALNALAKFGHFDENLVRALCSAAPGKVKDFTNQDIANTVNALAKIGYYDAVLLKELFFQITTIHQSAWTKEEHSQIYFALLGLTSERPDLSPIIPPQFRHESLHDTSELHASFVEKPMNSSKLHREVSTSLDLLKIQHKNESFVGGFYVDILVESGGENFIIEVNGPSHYVYGSWGSTARMLEGAHWRN